MDVNDNGIQENEPGRNSIFVQLLKVFPNGEQQFVNAAFTNANGEYQFTLPGADNYRVCFGNPGNFYVVSPPNAGNDDVDSDIDDIVGCSTYFTSGSEDIDIDAGFVPGLNIPCGTTFSHTINNLVCAANNESFSFNLNAVATPNSSGWTAYVNGTNTSGVYNQNKAFGPFNIADGAVTITIADNGDPNCFYTFTVEAPSLSARCRQRRCSRRRRQLREQCQSGTGRC